MTACAALCASSAAVVHSALMADGTQISFRQVDASDRTAFAALFTRLTPQSRHHRYLTPKRELTPAELTFFTNIDHLDHEAIAAIDQLDGSIVGVARYVRTADRPDKTWISGTPVSPLSFPVDIFALLRMCVAQRDTGWNFKKLTTKI